MQAVRALGYSLARKEGSMVFQQKGVVHNSVVTRREQKIAVLLKTLSSLTGKTYVVIETNDRKREARELLMAKITQEDLLAEIASQNRYSRELEAFVVQGYKKMLWTKQLLGVLKAFYKAERKGEIITSKNQKSRFCLINSLQKKIFEK